MATTYHNAGLNLSQITVNDMVYSASGNFLTAGSGETLILKTIQIANVTDPVAGTYYDVNVSAELLDASTSTTHSLGQFIGIPKHSSLDILADNLVLETGDKVDLRITGSSQGSVTYEVNAVGSYLKIT